MNLTDETLMAYADDEVDDETRVRIETALRDDAEARLRLQRHRALREAVQGAYYPVLEEPIPERLLAAARGKAASPAGNVTALSRARAAARAPINLPNRRGWQPAAMAASLLMGLGLGYLGWHNSTALVKSDSGGAMIAGAGLAEALSGQLGADRAAASAVTTGISFRNKAGDYCRTFSLSGTDPSSGLACREGHSWKIKLLAQSVPPQGDTRHFRQAGSAESAAVRAAVEQSIAGEPLDQAGELAARHNGWVAASPGH